MTNRKSGYHPKPYLLFRHISVELQVDALGMCSHDWHSYTRRRDVDIVVGPDLLRLLHHLHLFFIVAVLCHWAVVAEQVEGVLQHVTHILGSLTINFASHVFAGRRTWVPDSQRLFGAFLALPVTAVTIYVTSDAERKEKRKEKTTPFGVNLMRSAVLTGLPRPVLQA